MSLIDCPECDNGVSSKAESCPKCGYVLIDRTEKKKRGFFSGCGWLIIILIIVYAIEPWFDFDLKSSKSRSSRPRRPEQRQVRKSPGQETAEYRLACIDAGKLLPHDHWSVGRFAQLLDHLAQIYVEDRDQISSQSVVAQNLLRDKYGIEESIMNIMDGMNVIFEDGLANQRYAEYLTFYTQLRKQGMSHAEAIGDFSRAIESLRLL